jgi:hypothetical protein
VLVLRAARPGGRQPGADAVTGQLAAETALGGA